MGRFGPYIAIGDPDLEEKPKFYGLRPGQRIDTITLEQALALTKLPRQLGQTADEKTISTNIGRFGPFIRYGDKYVSLKPEDDPYTLSLERALELIEAKKVADAAKHIKDFPDTTIRVLNGRFGPYVTDGAKNARIPKDVDPAGLALPDCLTLLENAKPAFGRGRGKMVKPGAKAAKVSTKVAKPSVKVATATTKKAVTKKAATKKAATKKAITKKAVTKKAVTKKAAATKKAAVRPAPTKSVPA